ncbi:MAG: hydantoinase/oxoprolinase family protein [Thiotrichales bacterium]|nr:hydantoinase/oxoprolinase family protein [Thiotrichales bacterium]
MSEMKSATRIGVDVGGTFTDVVLEHDSALTTAKVLTTPSAPDDAVLAGIDDVLARSGVAPGAVGLLIHGTTLATNAIIERKGALTALVTTEGFRDVLDIGYESRYDQYDIMIEKPHALVPRERRLVVPERVDVHGRVLKPLDEAAAARTAGVLAQLGVESVGIGFLHSYANPAHERQAREIITAALPEVTITLSSEVCPEVREYERFCTTAANAYVQPLMASYLGRLRTRLEARGLAGPVLLMTSGGGLASLDTAIRFPIRLVESGPAGGAILAARVAAEMGLDRVISFDMGGTTAKICLINDFAPQTAREFEVDREARFTKGSGIPLRIPVIEMVEIGAGGGSIARVDAMGRIAVGPDSAGADPGPAAYGRGGTAPTITDADIALGRIDPRRFAGGKIALDVEAARRAITTDVATPLGLDARMAAFGVTEMVDETMSNAARVHTVEQGKAAAEHAVIAFGGAAPLHAGRLADKLGVDVIVVPTEAGVGSAVGFLRAPVAYEVVRSHNMRLRDFDPETANAIVEEMHAEALAVVRSGAPEARLEEVRGAYMRYVGQGHEIFVTFPERALGPDDARVVQQAFDAEYARLYRRTIPEAEVEVLTWALTLSTAADRPVPVKDVTPRPAPVPLDHLPVPDLETGEEHDVPLYWRPDLEPGVRLEGPAIVAEDETSTFVTRRFSARVAANRYLVVERRQGS